jgi:hypothetical protein
MPFFFKGNFLDSNAARLEVVRSGLRTVRSPFITAFKRMRTSKSVFLLLAVACIRLPATADSVLLGDISFQPDTPITGLDSIFLDNFTDLADLGCASPFDACGGIDISGTLSYVYLDSGGNTQNGSVAVPSTGPGSTQIFEFDPTLITFESAVLTGTISPSTFPLDDGSTFVSTGTFISDTLTPDVGFGLIAVESNGASAVPEPSWGGLVALGLMTLGTVVLRRRSASVL